MTNEANPNNCMCLDQENLERTRADIRELLAVGATVLNIRGSNRFAIFDNLSQLIAISLQADCM